MKDGKKMGRPRMYTGIFTATGRGFGFVETKELQEDLYIPEKCRRGAFTGDKVQALLLPGQKGKRQEAEIVKILEHGITHVVGTYEKSKNYGFVAADDRKIPWDIFIPKGCSKGAEDGHKVVAEITQYGLGNRNPEGVITEILGHDFEPGVDVMCIAKSYGLCSKFPEKVLKQAVRVSKDVTKADMQGRIDLRDVAMVTIDGEDAKDLDDAVSLSFEDGIYHLGVHIADVANYVQENSALDREALKRGTSVYLVDRVIPMLPPVLSNGICSLNAGEDRLAVSCLMDIDQNGQIKDYRLAETVIRVNRRMTYTDVKRILEDREQATIREYKSLVPMLEQMACLASILRKKRQKRGSIDFDLPETKIILDRDGIPLEVKPYERNTATKLIEDFMLVANETVAGHFFWQEIPFIYRTHDRPEEEKIQKLSAFIHNFGYYIKAKKEGIHPKELQKLLGRIEGTSEEILISRLALRSMKQAKYTTENYGHFGLACDCYCHFTSPIRRYPDLQIHRIIKEQLRGRLKENRISHYRGILPQVAQDASRLERRANEAERETEKLKKAQYMESRIGNIYEGVISGITSWGIYVELGNTVEGMIRASDLPGDFFYYDEKNYEMVGEKTGKRYRLGERLSVQVKAADGAARTIDFCIHGSVK